MSLAQLLLLQQKNHLAGSILRILRMPTGIWSFLTNRYEFGLFRPCQPPKAQILVCFRRRRVEGGHSLSGGDGDKSCDVKPL